MEPWVLVGRGEKFIVYFPRFENKIKEKGNIPNINNKNYNYF
jgi:hypothetical protein